MSQQLTIPSQQRVLGGLPQDIKSLTETSRPRELNQPAQGGCRDDLLRIVVEIFFSESDIVARQPSSKAIWQNQHLAFFNQPCSDSIFLGAGLSRTRRSPRLRQLEEVLVNNYGVFIPRSLFEPNAQL